ncbi:MAG: fimbrillin family protein [bacterium]
MKKIFFSVAILAMLASCSSNEEIAISQSDVIGFSTLNNRVTRVANTNADGESSDYEVFAKSSETTATSWLMNEVILVVENEDDAISSGLDYYWPASPATVDFYAFAPKAGTDGVTLGTVVYAGDYDGDVKDGTPSIPLTFTVPTDAGIDFTVATPIKGITYDTETYTNGLGQVQLKFAHMLSKASLKVVLDENLDDEYSFYFTSATFTVVNNGVTVNAVDTTGIENVFDGWAPVAATLLGSAGDATDSIAYDYNFDFTNEEDESVLDSAITKTASNELYFAPHIDGDLGATGCRITLTGVEIMANANGSRIFSGDLVYDLDETVSFQKGTAYAFQITLNADAADLILITFSSEEIEWIDGGTIEITSE